MLPAPLDNFVPSRDAVLRLERTLAQMPQGDFPLTHHFSMGVYAREVLIPKGSIVVGKIHRWPHLNFIMKGDISVMTEHGVRRITGGCVLQSSAGIKRAGYAHEDTVWITVHPNPEDETDLKKLEEIFIAPEFLESIPAHDEVRALMSEVQPCHG